MADFIKDFIIIELFYYSEAADSVFNGYMKFKTIILIVIAVINRCIASTNLSFRAEKQHGSNWQLVFCNFKKNYFLILSI